MTRTPNAAIADRFRTLADTLTRNATLLSTAGLPETVVATRATVYRDVAAQLQLLAQAELDQAAGNPLVVALPEREAAVAVARRFEQLAGLLAANARTLTTRTTDAVMRARAGIYRDVASQVRLLAAAQVELATVRVPAPTRAPLSNVAPLSPIVARAAVRAPRVRAVFLEALVAAIAKRRHQGWSVARLTLWLRTTLRDPQTDAAHPCADRSFVAYVTALVTGPQPVTLAA
ncbi:hypothetical protein OHS58_48545 [Amycolatopsis sp. NBC_00348]|uniref:hypothetical protein n=1 Tax=unclassified Amycolatopsis TaxID=2618356 RepID=UPI002E261826|nr:MULTISPECIES: hypothetical protein [unclassified Amycolatopsis]